MNSEPWRMQREIANKFPKNSHVISQKKEGIERYVYQRPERTWHKNDNL